MIRESQPGVSLAGYFPEKILTMNYGGNVEAKCNECGDGPSSAVND
jgi:hypothetical protein